MKKKLELYIKERKKDNKEGKKTCFQCIREKME